MKKKQTESRSIVTLLFRNKNPIFDLLGVGGLISGCFTWVGIKGISVFMFFFREFPISPDGNSPSLPSISESFDGERDGVGDGRLFFFFLSFLSFFIFFGGGEGEILSFLICYTVFIDS